MKNSLNVCGKCLFELLYFSELIIMSIVECIHTQQCSKRIERFAFSVVQKYIFKRESRRGGGTIGHKKNMMAQQQHRGKEEARREREQASKKHG